MEKPRAFDPRGQATVTPRGKICLVGCLNHFIAFASPLSPIRTTQRRHTYERYDVSQRGLLCVILLRLFFCNILLNLLNECAGRLDKVLDVLLIHVDNAVVVALVAQLLQTSIYFVFLH